MKYTITTSLESARNASGLTPSTIVSASAKAFVVTLLAWVSTWQPGFARVLGLLVLTIWPNFRRA